MFNVCQMTVTKDLPDSQMKQSENDMWWNMAKGHKNYSENDISEVRNKEVFVWSGGLTLSFSAWMQLKLQQPRKVREVQEDQRSKDGEKAHSLRALIALIKDLTFNVQHPSNSSNYLQLQFQRIRCFLILWAPACTWYADIHLHSNKYTYNKVNTFH